MEDKKIQQYKIDAVKQLAGEIADVNDVFFTEYRGLTVQQITELRNELRKNEGEYHIVKNSYARLVFKDMKIDNVQDFLVGPTALAYAKGESGPIAKALLKFAKGAPLILKGGLVNGDVFDPKSVEEYSKLPTKPELIQMLMGTMQAPIRNMACALNDVTVKLVRTLAAVADSKESE